MSTKQSLQFLATAEGQMKRIILRETFCWVGGGGGVFEMQKDWTAMKEGSGTRKKKDGERADDKHRSRWYEKRKKTQRKNSHEAFCRTSLKFNVNFKKRTWLKVSKVRETVFEVKLSNPELVYWEEAKFSSIEWRRNECNCGALFRIKI